MLIINTLTNIIEWRSAIKTFGTLFSYHSLLHDHLLSILTTNNYEQESLPEKALQYVGMIV